MCFRRRPKGRAKRRSLKEQRKLRERARSPETLRLIRTADHPRKGSLPQGLNPPGGVRCPQDIEPGPPGRESGGMCHRSRFQLKLATWIREGLSGCGPAWLPARRLA